MLGYMQTWYLDACGISYILYYCHKDSRGSLEFLCGWTLDPNWGGKQGVGRDDTAASIDLVEPISPILPPRLAQAVLLESQ